MSESTAEIRARRMKWPELLMECEEQNWYAKRGSPNNLKVYMNEVRRRINESNKINTRTE